MAFNTIPTSLEEENKKRKRLKAEAKEFFKYISTTIDDSEEEKKEEQEIGPVTFEEELKKAFTPYVESGKYKESELEVIKKSLSNDISGGNQVEGQPTKEPLKTNLNLTEKTNKGVSWIKKNTPKKPGNKYIEIIPDYLNSNSLFSSVVPDNRATKGSYYDPSLKEIIGPGKYEEALINRKQIEINKDNSLGYLRIYDDSVYGLGVNNEGFEVGREYVEIDGIRRTRNQAGQFVYEIYNIEDALSEETNIDIETELEKASKDQIELFDDKLFDYEWENITNQYLNSENLTAGGDDQVQAEVSINIADEDKVVTEVNNVDDVDVVLSNMDEETMKKLLKIAFDEALGTEELDYERFRQETPLNDEFKKRLEEEGITFKIYTKGNEADLIGIFRGNDKLGTLKAYGDPLNPEYYNIEQHMEDRALVLAQDKQEILQAISQELFEKWKPKFDLFFRGTVDSNNEPNMDGFDYTVIDSFPKIIRDLEPIEITYPTDPSDPMYRKDLAGQTMEYVLLPDIYKKGRRGKPHTYIRDDKYIQYKSQSEIKNYTDDILDYFEEMGLPRPTIQSFKKTDALKHGLFISAQAWDELFKKKKASMLINNKEYNELLKEQDLDRKNVVDMAHEAYRFEPEWKHFPTTIVDEINSRLSSTGFESASTYHKKTIIDNLWKGLEEYNKNQQIAIQNDESLSSEEKEKQFNAVKSLSDKQKKEFFFMMYEKHLAWQPSSTIKATEQDVKDGLADEVGGPVKEFSVYALKDLARDILSPEKFGEGGIAGLLAKAREKGDTVVEKKLEYLLKYADLLLKADEKTLSGKDGPLDAFVKGFTSNEWYEYLPFASSISKINESTWLKGASDRIMNSDMLQKSDPRYDESIEAATAEDRMMMSFYRMHTMMETKLEEAGGTMGTMGKIVADMFPYMGEFAMTGGLYTHTQKAVNEGLKYAMYHQAVQHGKLKFLRPDNVFKFAQRANIPGGVPIFGISKEMGMKLSDDVAGFVSYIFGTAAHAAGNPQQYILHTIERMTPQTKFVLSNKFDDVVTSADLEVVKTYLLKGVEIQGFDPGIVEYTWDKGSWEGQPINFEVGEKKTLRGFPYDEAVHPKNPKDGFFYADEDTKTLYQYNAKSDSFKKIKKKSEYYQTYLDELDRVEKEAESKKIPTDFDISVYEGMTIDEILQYNTDNFENKEKLIDGQTYTASLTGQEYTYDGNVAWDGEIPEGLREAFWTAYGLTWAEMSTERLGEFLPGAVQWMTPAQLRGFGEYTRRMTIGRIAEKIGLGDRSELLGHIITNQMGYHGWIAEVGEETVNQALSSMIMGKNWDEGFLDEDGNWDEKFFVEMGGAMFITSLTFSGGNYIQMRRRINKKNK